MKLFIDLEATCWDDSLWLRGTMEIIEIGALLCDDGLNYLKGYDLFVQPINKELSDYCKRLTGIKQKYIDKAPDFKSVFKTFCIELSEFCESSIVKIPNDKGFIDVGVVGKTDASIYCWGDYDVKQLLQDCGRWGIKYPFGYEYVNVKNEFYKKYGKKCGLYGALDIIELQPYGVHHRGFDDAVNVYRIYRCLCGLSDINTDEIKKKCEM